MFESNTPGIVEYYPDVFKLDRLNRLWLHECNPIIPILDDDKILKIMSQIPLNSIDKEKNKISENVIYIMKPSLDRNITITIESNS